METLLTVDAKIIGRTKILALFCFDHPDGSGEKIGFVKHSKFWIDGKHIKQTKAAFLKFHKDQLESRTFKAAVKATNSSSAMSLTAADGRKFLPTFMARCMWLGDPLPPEEERMPRPNYEKKETKKIERGVGRVMFKDASLTSAISFLEFPGFNRNQLASFTMSVFFIDGVHADEKGFSDWANNKLQDEKVSFEAVCSRDWAVQNKFDEIYSKMPELNMYKRASYKCRAVWIGSEPSQELKEWISSREEVLEKSMEKDRPPRKNKREERKRGKMSIPLKKVEMKRPSSGRSKDDFRDRRDSRDRSPSPKRSARSRNDRQRGDDFDRRPERTHHRREDNNQESRRTFNRREEDYYDDLDLSEPLHVQLQRQLDRDSRIEELQQRYRDYGDLRRQDPPPHRGLSPTFPSSNHQQNLQSQHPNPTAENPIMVQAKNLLARVMKCSTPDDDNIDAVISGANEIQLAVFISKTLDRAVNRFNVKQQMLSQRQSEREFRAPPRDTYETPYQRTSQLPPRDIHETPYQRTSQQPPHDTYEIPYQRTPQQPLPPRQTPLYQDRMQFEKIPSTFIPSHVQVKFSKYGSGLAEQHPRQNIGGPLPQSYYNDIGSRVQREVPSETTRIGGMQREVPPETVRIGGVTYQRSMTAEEADSMYEPGVNRNVYNY